MWRYCKFVFQFGYYLATNLDNGRCLDSILINGKGAVNCQTAQALQSFETPPMKALLNGSQLTDKG